MTMFGYRHHRSPVATRAFALVAALLSLPVAASARTIERKDVAPDRVERQREMHQQRAVERDLARIARPDEDEPDSARFEDA